MRLSYFQGIGSTTTRTCTASQPVLTRYKLLEIERPGTDPLRVLSGLTHGIEHVPVAQTLHQRQGWRIQHPPRLRQRLGIDGSDAHIDRG